MAVSLCKSFFYGMYLKAEVLGHKGCMLSILFGIYFQITSQHCYANLYFPQQCYNFSTSLWKLKISILAKFMDMITQSTSLFYFTFSDWWSDSLFILSFESTLIQWLFWFSMHQEQLESLFKDWRTPPPDSQSFWLSGSGVRLGNGLHI